MEEIKKEEHIEVEETADTETEAEDTSPEQKETDTTSTDTEEDETESDEEQDIDHEKELEKLNSNKTVTTAKSEAEKAARALHFNAKRAQELGLDPAEVLGIKKPQKQEEDVDSKIDRRFTEEKVQQMAETEAEYKHIMWYVENKGLSPEDAYVLANKGRLQRAIGEAKRANVRFGKPSTERRHVDETVPERSKEEQDLLRRRGMNWNPKTKTWRGRFYEEYYDTATKTWASRKISR